MEEKRQNDGVVSGKLMALFELAQDLDSELQFINGDTEISKKIKSLDLYKQGVSDFMSQYSAVKDQLLMRSDVETLLSFIIEWSIFDPSILIGLAKNINLYQCFFNIPERMKRRV
jgi:hypothetical protein